MRWKFNDLPTIQTVWCIKDKHNPEPELWQMKAELHLQLHFLDEFYSFTKDKAPVQFY